MFPNTIVGFIFINEIDCLFNNREVNKCILSLVDFKQGYSSNSEEESDNSIPDFYLCTQV